MENASTIALSRLVAQTRAMDVTATNLANIGTPGYRTERMLFSDWLVREPTTSDAGSLPPGGRVLAYTQDRATYRNNAAGAVSHTNNPLDLSIGGGGFFTVQAPTGPRLTRAGHFARGSNGTIQDESGLPLLDINGRPIQLAQADTVITISANGTISSQNGQVGQIGVVQPQDPNKMRAEGGRLLASDSPTQAVAAPQIVQGTLEESNVQPTLEVTRMMTDLREFQFTSQFLQAESDRQQSAIDKITQRRN
jgi:flagellar basal-body rod protein FlgF